MSIITPVNYNSDVIILNVHFHNFIIACTPWMTINVHQVNTEMCVFVY